MRRTAGSIKTIFLLKKSSTLQNYCCILYAIFYYTHFAAATDLHNQTRNFIANVIDYPNDLWTPNSLVYRRRVCGLFHIFLSRTAVTLWAFNAD